MRNPRKILAGSLLILAGCTIIAIAPSCSGERGPPGTSVVIERIEEVPGLTLPGVLLEISSVSGGSGANGAFRAGNKLSITFTIKTTAGNLLAINSLGLIAAMVSGPSFNYQRVIARQNDLAAESVANADGSYTYTFPDPIPETYLAPFNDSASFGIGDGELAGEALLAGTYTVGLEAYKEYLVGQETERDAGNATRDFLFGSAASLDAREVVTVAHCNQCHREIQAHGGIRVNNVKQCLLCHTAGAEDRNVGAVEGGTPGRTIDFRVMIHKIHNGSHLPSVLGVATNPDGSRNYAATAMPYRLIGFGNEAVDFSEVGFPVMPSAYVAYLFDEQGDDYLGTGGNGPMPRDTGYAALPQAAKIAEDRVRTGVVDCAKCHGDPDGAGPLEAPAQGELHLVQPTRRSCGSCHDDVDWTRPYTSQGQTMPPQSNDSACVLCHASEGVALAVKDAHLHPYSNPAFNAGLNIEVTSVGGGTGPDGNHAGSDPIEATFRVTNDAGADLQIQTLLRFQQIVSGPTSNPQVILPNITAFDSGFRKSTPFTGGGSAGSLSVGAATVDGVLALVFTGDNTFDVVRFAGASFSTLASGIAVPDGGDTGSVTHGGVTFKVTDGTPNFAAGDRFYFEAVPTASSYSRAIPIDVALERVGEATGGADVFTVANLPLYWGRQTVFERTATQAGTILATAAASLGRFIAVDLAAIPGIAVGDRVVIEDGVADQEEYVTVGRLQTTDDVTGLDLGAADRIWFTTALRYGHSAGAAVQEVTLTSKREGTAYDVTEPDAGEVTLIAGQFTAGNPVVVSYRTYGRFGIRRHPGDAVQAVYPAAFADAEEIDAAWGDWKGLTLLDGTYTVGMYVNSDFTVTPLGALATTTLLVDAASIRTNNLATDNTTYRAISPPATRDFLFGAAAALEPRAVISDLESCNTCHGDITAHGNGRRGLETCLLCHSISGVEDGPKYTFSAWYVGPTPGRTMDFRTLLHKIHNGKELAEGSAYEVNGVFLGIPYPVTYEKIGFPVMPGGTKQCETCHGDDSESWQEPAAREHPDQTTPPRVWYSTCTSCHDSSAAAAHVDINTSGGVESCSVCHGAGREISVEASHRTF